VTTVWVQLAAGSVAGLAVAWLFLRTLQASVARLAGRRRPGWVWLGGFVLRTSVVVAAFAAVLHWWQLPGLVAALVGFTVGRVVGVRRMGRGP